MPFLYHLLLISFLTSQVLSLWDIYSSELLSWLLLGSTLERRDIGFQQRATCKPRVRMSSGKHTWGSKPCYLCRFFWAPITEDDLLCPPGPTQFSPSRPLWCVWLASGRQVHICAHIPHSGSYCMLYTFAVVSDKTCTKTCRPRRKPFPE